MTKKIIYICRNGWCNDAAPWSHVLTALLAAAVLYLSIIFICFGWMIIVY